MYAVCKNGNCAQTYAVDDIVKGRSKEVFMKDIRITKGYHCKKCGAIVIDKDGQGMFSGHSTVIPCITVEDLRASEKEQLKRAKRKVKQAKKELKELKKQYADC